MVILAIQHRHISLSPLSPYLNGMLRRRSLWPGMIEIREERRSSMATYAVIPSRVEVREVLEVIAVDGGLGGLMLQHRTVEEPYIKDYDVPAAQHPSHWSERFDLSRWGFLTGYLADQVVARAAVAWDALDVHMLDAGPEVAVLWDLRVHPAAQRRRIGSAMFTAAEDWARTRGVRTLIVETQNVNVPACRLYMRMGCTLGAIRRFAYPDVPHETQLLWYKDLL